MSGWQPIETAPKDGTYILLHNDRLLGPPYIAQWCAEYPDFGECWLGPADISLHNPIFFTHWMPLPEPPR